jgi:type VI secretion system protein ImpJ
MTPTSPLPDAVQWSEGMMLSPQHFQQNDRYWHAHLRHRLQAIAPHYWGVLRLHFDIVGETVSIGELECLMPDGLLVAFPGTSQRHPPGNVELEVGGACKTGDAPLKVWCWVNQRGARAACQDSLERRYNSILEVQTLDENTGDNGLSLPRLQVNFQLYLGASSPAPDCAVPLLEIVRGANQQLEVTPYHPPLLHIGSADGLAPVNLWRNLLQLHDRLWDKLTQLGEPGKTGDAEENMGSERRQHLAAARNIAAALPQLSVLLHTQTHPSQLYQVLAQIVGALSGIGVNPLPLLMKPYQHEDCMPQFQQAMAYIQARLDSVDTRHEILTFQRTDLHDPSQQDACFERRLLAGMTDELIIELEPREAQTAAQLLAWLDEALIADAALIPQLRRARVAGAVARPLQAHEIEREKLRPQAFLFVIKNQRLTLDDQGSEDAFRENQVLQIQGGKNASLPASIKLYHKKQKSGAVSPAPAEAHHE